MMETNKEFELARDYVNNTNRCVFLTGNAGTGKTTFLHHLKQESLKRIVVVAPTGVAAINAKGVTIHSFFQLPFGPILPHSKPNPSEGFNRKFSKTKINIIKSLDLLIIDEISMVRADVLDGIDSVLKRFRDRTKTFGGVQVLMIGDLSQLAPVIKDSDWAVLQPYYQTGYFFSSYAYQQCQAVIIELKQIYRQENPRFIQILNEIRNNTLTESSANILNQRYIKDFKPNPKEGYVMLTTHNHKADDINEAELRALPSEEYSYDAEITGTFPNHAFPNALALRFKVGAQVMFIKNDSTPEKRYFNGKIGEVVWLDKNEIAVKCADDDDNIITTPETWENIKYTVNPETKAITEEKTGAFSQMPLRLAWAITIHKSQGLTFEKAIVDAEAAFAHGQTYVALSRCKSLEGLVLKSKISPNQIINDEKVSSFIKLSNENEPDDASLQLARREFQLEVLYEIFDYYAFLRPINRLLDIFYKNRTSIHGHIESPLITMKDEITGLLKVNQGFAVQLKQMADTGDLPENNLLIQERFKKGLVYFKIETEKNIAEPLKSVSFTTDNKAIEKDMERHLDNLEELLRVKQSYFKGLTDGFSLLHFLELRAHAVFLTKVRPKPSRPTVVEGTSHLELFERLRELRNDLANENNVPHYQVFTQKSLYELCEVLPVSKRQLLKIHGFGKVRVERYGTQILEHIKAYCKERDIELINDADLQEPPQKLKKKTVKGDSKRISLALFKSGKTIPEIAAERNLVESTIFTHLSAFMASGEIKITDLVSETVVDELKTSIPKLDYDNLSDLKRQLDDAYSYQDIRLVLQLLSSEEKNNLDNN